MYLSDISGAFDKVRRALLIGKLSQLGLPSIWLDFLNAYLADREGLVIEEGAISEAMLLSNMIFQGTVLESYLLILSSPMSLPKYLLLINLSIDLLTI